MRGRREPGGAWLGALGLSKGPRAGNWADRKPLAQCAVLRCRCARRMGRVGWCCRAGAEQRMLHLSPAHLEWTACARERATAHYSIDLVVVCYRELADRSGKARPAATEPSLSREQHHRLVSHVVRAEARKNPTPKGKRNEQWWKAERSQRQRRNPAKMGPTRHWWNHRLWEQHTPAGNSVRPQEQLQKLWIFQNT